MLFLLLSRLWLFLCFTRGYNNFSFTYFLRCWFTPNWNVLFLLTRFKFLDRIQFCSGCDFQGSWLFRMVWLLRFFFYSVKLSYVIFDLSLSGRVIDQLDWYWSQRLLKLLKWNLAISIQIYPPHNIWKFFFHRLVANFNKEASNCLDVNEFVVSFINRFETVTQAKIRKPLKVFLLLLNSQQKVDFHA